MNKEAFIMEFKKYLKNRSLPFTPEREAAVNIICDMDSHFTVEELLGIVRQKKLRVSRATLYRTILVLLDSKLLTKLSRMDKPPVYETVLEKRPHNHFLCNKCGSIIEFESPEIEDRIRKISLENRFVVSSHSLKIYGNCPACAGKDE
jgi:Fur family ferric uptake transcriptional regulator